jgi:hypothetical protein
LALARGILPAASPKLRRSIAIRDIKTYNVPMRRVTLRTKWAFTLCLLASAALLAAQNSNPQPKAVQNPNAQPQKHIGFGGKTAPDLENDQVVINAPQPWPGCGDPPGADIPKGITARFGVRPWHNHKLSRVMIYLQPGGERLNFMDGSIQVLKWQKGTVLWSPAAGFHYTDQHSWDGAPPPPSGSTVVGQFHAISIKKAGYPNKAGGTALDPLKVDPKDFKLEFENSQVRVLRLKMAPRQSVPMHEYGLDHVVVYLTEQNVRETSPEGKADVTKHEMFDYIWHGPSKQKIDNLNDKPFEAVVVELKTIY